MTRTFRSASAIGINDEAPASPYPSRITVSGLKRGKLLDVNLTLFGFTHTYPSDVDMLLVAPNGRSAVILSDVGSSDDIANQRVVIDDQASAPLPASLIVSGRYQPRNNEDLNDSFPAPATSSPNVALATFNGINPNGTWKLYVVDDSSSDIGYVLGGWALTIKARVRV